MMFICDNMQRLVVNTVGLRPRSFRSLTMQERGIQGVYPNGVNRDQRIIYSKAKLGNDDQGMLFAFDAVVMANEGLFFGAKNSAWTFLF